MTARPAAGAEERLYVCSDRTRGGLAAVLAHQTAMRVMKIAGEAGEAVAAYSGVTGNNPRKGVTATPDELASELCDVILAALVALATVTGGTPQAESALTRHVAARATRLRALRAAA